MEGTKEGDICNRNECNGIIKFETYEQDGCTCFNHPPCSYCTDSHPVCPECDWNIDNDKEWEM